MEWDTSSRWFFDEDWWRVRKQILMWVKEQRIGEYEVLSKWKKYDKKWFNHLGQDKAQWAMMAWGKYKIDESQIPREVSGKAQSAQASDSPYSIIPPAAPPEMLSITKDFLN